MRSNVDIAKETFAMRPTLFLPMAALAALAACNSGEPEPAAPAESGIAAASAPTATPVATPTTSALTKDQFEDMDLPVALHGRWGMGTADCDPTRDDAKGLMVVGPRRLEFYESVGTLDDLDEFEPTRIRGDFDFTGEGMEWDRSVTLELQDNGSTLIRRESGSDAEPGPYRYTKCA
jgi:hypothetical protein